MGFSIKFCGLSSASELIWEKVLLIQRHQILREQRHPLRKEERKAASSTVEDEEWKEALLLRAQMTGMMMRGLQVQILTFANTKVFIQ